MTLSVRARLALAFTFVFSALLILFTSVVFLFLKAGLERKLKEDSLHDIGVLVTNLTKPNWRDEVLEMPDESDEYRLLIRIFDEKGQLMIVGGSVTASEWPYFFDLVRRTVDGPDWSETIIKGIPHLVLTHAFTPPGERPHFIQIANSKKDLDWILAHFIRYSSAGSFLVLIVAVIAGFFFSRRALQPVEKIRARAEMINFDRLDQRLVYDGPPDELHRLTQTLNDLLSRIQHSINQTKNFIADASHELRIPLAGLRGTLEVGLRQKRSPEESREIMETAYRESERMSDLVSDLLSLARADAGGLRLDKTDVDLESFFKDVFRTAEALNVDKKVTLEWGAIPRGKMRLDEGRAHQLLINLIENAIRYNKPNGSVTVSATLKNEHLLISIKDTGLGISSEDQAKIFDRFFRVDKARAREVGGTGLGLSIARTIAEAHKGTISVSSVLGEGSEFLVAIPVF